MISKYETWALAIEMFELNKDRYEKLSVIKTRHGSYYVVSGTITLNGGETIVHQKKGSK